MKLTLPYPVSVNAMYRNSGGGVVLAERVKSYKESVGWLAKQAGARMLHGPLRVTLRLYRPRRHGDLDNLTKALLDALNGITWKDDSQIVELHAYRYEDKRSPRVEVEIEEVSHDQDTRRA